MDWGSFCTPNMIGGMMFTLLFILELSVKIISTLFEKKINGKYRYFYDLKMYDRYRRNQSKLFVKQGTSSKLTDEEIENLERQNNEIIERFGKTSTPSSSHEIVEWHAWGTNDWDPVYNEYLETKQNILKQHNAKNWKELSEKVKANRRKGH